MTEPNGRRSGDSMTDKQAADPDESDRTGLCSVRELASIIIAHIHTLEAMVRRSHPTLL